MPSVIGVILTGGESRRMGTDKAFVVVAGRPMVIRVADALWEAGCAEVMCQGGDVTRLGQLGLAAVPDGSPGGGPAAAVGEVLSRATAPLVLAACDLADLDAATVRDVVDAGADTDRVAVAVTTGRPHLLSYWPDSARSAVDAALAAGVVAYHDLLDAVDALHVPVGAVAMRNVNTPDEVPGDR